MLSINDASPCPVKAATRLFQAVAAVLIGLSFTMIGGAAMAASHREAPFITEQPKVDGTDLYFFRSYESGRANFVTIVADYVPLQNPGDGPNYYFLDPDALYEIHIDNSGDAKEDITFQFQFTNKLNNVALPVGGKQVAIPLTQAGPISAGDSSKLNVTQTYTVDIVHGNRRSARSHITNANGGGTTFTKPVDNIGQKTLPNYEAYAAQYLYTINIPGCATPGRMFVGQRKDPFVVALGRTFDLINLNPLGAPDANRDDLAGKNVTALALELPISCLTNGDPVLGAWTTASLRQGRLLVPDPQGGIDGAQKSGGAWSQVSRLGMPLVNEVVIGLPDKDRFNNSKPMDDAQFADYVTNPTLPALIETLFPSARAPTNFPRKDLVAAFLTGIKGLNQPSKITPSEMLRLNTSIAPTAAGSQSNLGALTGDNAGYPNGRRPGDDVVDISLRVAMGVLCTLNQPAVFGCVPADAPAGGLPFTDGATVNEGFFNATFPYLKTPLPGAPN